MVPLKLFLLIFGAPELVRLALNKENITLPHCCTSSPVSKNQKGLSYGIQRCRPWNISVANGNPRYGQTGILALYQRTMSSRWNEVTRYLFFPLQKHQHRFIRAGADVLYIVNLINHHFHALCSNLYNGNRAF